MARLFGATLPNENNLIDPSAVNFGDLAKSVVNNPFVQAVAPSAIPVAYGINVAQTYDRDRVQDIGVAGGSPGNTFPFTQPSPAMPAAATPQAQIPVAAPIATPDNRVVPAADQGMNWAKAAAAAVKGFGVTPAGQGVQSMEERGLVRSGDAWVPSEALQQAVEANYQAGVAARNPVIQQPPMSQSELLDKELARYSTPTTGMGALAMLAGAKSNVASQFEADEAARRAGEKQQDIGLRGLATRMQGKELELKMQEAPAMRDLREAQAQQAMAEGAFTREKTKLYPETIKQSQLAAEQKAVGTYGGKIQDAITKLQVARGNAIDPKVKAEYDAQIAEYRKQQADLAK